MVHQRVVSFSLFLLSTCLCLPLTRAFRSVHNWGILQRQNLALFYKSSSDDNKLTPMASRQDNALAWDAKALQVSAWSQEWHDSFARNGLVDFVPPLTDSLDCLIVGQDEDGFLDWNYKIAGHSTANEDTSTETPTMSLSLPWDVSVLTDLAPDDNASDKSYDCLLDGGRMDSALQEEEASCGVIQATLMLQQATCMLKEHGIYVVKSAANGLMAQSHVQEYLRQVGGMLGLQWHFGLDGLSHETQMISVARKYENGEMPSFGKLSTVKMPSPLNNPTSAQQD